VRDKVFKQLKIQNYQNLPYNITHLGGTNTVTGSCHLLSANKLNIMVDCGISQGDDRVQDMSSWPIPPKEIDYLFLTHCHIDHIGRLPELIENGFQGEIICTHATKALLEPMLKDAMGFLNISKKETNRLWKEIDELSSGFEYGETCTLRNGITFRLGQAGHILGSCFVRLACDQDQPFSIIFSGDLGNTNTPILPDPEPPDHCDLLILESTYGDRLHEGREDRRERFGEILLQALADNGKVFIPAFALGRTQEILFELDLLFASPKWLERLGGTGRKNGLTVPVFIDSPLGLSITKLYANMPQFWDKESQHRLHEEQDHPFDFEKLYSVDRYKDHLKLLEISGPAVIIAGSGMCTGGRIIDHLVQGLSDPKNDIVFVGYQAENTLGQKIIRSSKHPNGYVWIDNQKVPVKARVHKMTGFSAHADQQGLLAWVKSMPAQPKEIRLVHGETRARQSFADLLHSQGYNVQENK